MQTRENANTGECKHGRIQKEPPEAIGPWRSLVSIVLGNRKLRIPAHLLRLKAKHNIFFRDAERDKHRRNPVFCVVAPYPQFAIHNIHMSDRKMNTPAQISPVGYQQIAVSRAIKNGFTRQIAKRIWDSSILLKDALNKFAVMF